jgi:hypothetical protein
MQLDANKLGDDRQAIPAVATLLLDLGARLAGAPLAEGERNEFLKVARGSPRPNVQGHVDDALEWLQKRYRPSIITGIPR